MSLKKYNTLAKHIKNWTLYFKRLHEKGETTTYTTKGKCLTFSIPPVFFFVFKEIFMEDFYNIKSLLQNIKNDATIVDIGCNMGLFSFMVASKKSDCKIYAYDPMEINTTIFNNNILKNKDLDKQIFVYTRAVTGKEQGPIELYFDDIKNDSVIASVFENFSSQNNKKKIVETVSLQKIILQNKIQKVDLLKLDCEGSEYPILYDSPIEIFNSIENMTIETHELDNEKQNTKALVTFLKNLGYQIEIKQGENRCFSLRVFKK